MLLRELPVDTLLMMMQRNQYHELADEVARACRILGQLDLTHGTLGHVSHRVPGADAMLVRGKGADETALRYTEADDVVLVDFQGDVLDSRPGLRAPSECFIHIWLYRLNPDVQCVVHAHSRSSVLLSITGQEVRPVYGNYGYGSRLAATGVPTYGYPFSVDDDARGEEFARVMGAAPAALMRGHGVTVVGRSLPEAMVRTIALEELTSITVDASRIGTVQPLNDEEVAYLERGLDPARTRGTASEDQMIAGFWRYYLRLTGEGKGDAREG